MIKVNSDKLLIFNLDYTIKKQTHLSPDNMTTVRDLSPQKTNNLKLSLIVDICLYHSKANKTILFTKASFIL
jgi:hypothetical protein